MSKELSAANAEIFDTQVKQKYQLRSGLRETVTKRSTGGSASIYHFRAMGKGMANKKGSSEEVTPMNVGHSKIPCALENWNAPEFTDIFDQADVNFDEKSELAQTIGFALGRRDDQLIIDALDAASAYAGTVTVSIGGTNTDLNTAKLRRAKRFLDDKGVSSVGRYILVSAYGVEAMLGTTEATSADYNNVKALAQGEINAFCGFMFKFIEQRDENGLTKSGSTRDAYAYHSDAVGHVQGLDMRTEVNYIPTRTSWLSNGLMKAGAVVRDTDGVVKVQTYEA